MQPAPAAALARALARGSAARGSLKLERYDTGALETLENDMDEQHFRPSMCCISQSVITHYHTPSRELTAYTHTLLWSSFKCAAGISQHLLLSSGRSSYFRMVFYSFHFLPIFLLAQIL